MTRTGGSAALRSRLAAVAVAAVAIAVVVFGLLEKEPPLETVATYPAEGAAIDGAERPVWVGFRGAERVSVFHLAVSRRGGAPVATTDTRLAGQQLVTTVPDLPVGEYLMGYHLELADGRAVSGLSTFRVAEGGDPPPVDVPDGDGPGVEASPHVHGGKDPLSGVLIVVNVALIGLVAVLFLRRRRAAARSE